MEIIFFFIFGIMAGETIKDYVEPEPWTPSIEILYETDVRLMTDSSQYPIDMFGGL